MTGYIIGTVSTLFTLLIGYGVGRASLTPREPEVEAEP